MTQTATVPVSPTPASRRPVLRLDPTKARSRIPHTAHLREFTFPDGRKILIDRRALAFVCEGKIPEVNQVHTLVAFRTAAKPCPILADYATVKAWWFGGADDKKNAA